MIQFDAKAMAKFNQIPDNIKSKILSNVYCSKCAEMVTIVDFNATVDAGDLILTGKCNKCSNKVVRLIEGD